jgi:cytoskeleton protein RodZ
MRPGDILRYQREQEGLTVERAAEQSRINPSVIHAIETGETDGIPRVYLRGYIRNYARFLGVDISEFGDYMDTVKGAEPELKSVFTSTPRPPSSERWLKASSYVAASVLVAALAWQFTHEALRFSQGNSSLGTPPVAVAPENTQGEAPGSGETQNRHLNASIAAVEMIRERGASASPAQQAWSALNGEAVPADSLADGVHALSVVTSADTWIEIIDGSGQYLEQDLVRADSRREYSGLAPFRVMLGRASAVLLEIDGKTVDLAPHTRGNVARLTLGRNVMASNDTTSEAVETEVP